jgi:hypothetical protein
MFTEIRHNYPEGHKDKPWCPRTQLVQIGAALTGLELTPDTFCTERLVNARFSGGAIHYLESGSYNPAASCAKINKELLSQLSTINSKIALPSEAKASVEINKAKGMVEKQKLFESYKSEKDKYDARQKIIDRWRGVIFETCCSTTADDENAHFRKFGSADELMEDEIVRYVKHFSKVFEELIGYEKNTLGWWSDAAKNCNQSPHDRSVGPLH